MPWIKRKNLVWLFGHSYYPTFADKKGFRFGSLPYRKTIEEAIEDAIASSRPYERKTIKEDA